MEELLTQSDLAKRLGMPRTTVAAALNPKTATKLRPEVRKRVREAAQRYGYVPHHAARSLMLRKTHTIAVVSSASLRHSYVHEVIEQLRLELARHGYHMSLDFSYQFADEQATLATLASGRCDGVVRLGFPFWARTGMLTLRNRGLPVVILQPWPDPDFDTIGTDRREEGSLAIHHLLERGHRTIATVVGPDETGKLSDRVEGDQQALREAGAVTSLIFRYPVEGDVKALWEQIKSVRPRPTATFVYNDELAMRLAHAIRIDGGRVPEDMALVTSGNTWVGRLSEVPMTSIDQNRAELARLTAARLLERMEYPEAPPRHMSVAPFLVARQSSERQPSEAG